MIQDYRLVKAQSSQAPNGQIIQVGERLYQVSEIQNTGISHPIYPSPIQPVSPWDNPKFVIGFAVAGIIGSGLVAVVLVRAFAPVPTASPSTVIVQPPQPERRPYSRRECRASGLFGWGSDCQEERGYE